MQIYNLPSLDRQTDTVILANGEFPSHPIPLSILKNAQYIVCCDGATNNISQTDILPHAIVGDCDSLSKENQSKYTNIIHRVSEQDTNDLTKAVHFCLNSGKSKLTILGATGKREDHTLGNISLLCEYMQYADVEMITDFGIFIGIKEASTFESFVKQQVSLFSLDRKPITTHNLVYAVKNHIFSNWWQGTLNESDSDSFIIETEGRMIIYRAFP